MEEKEERYLFFSFILPMMRFAWRLASHFRELNDNVATEEDDLDIMRKMVLRRVVIFCFANQNNGVFYYRWILECTRYFLRTTYI